MHGDEHVAGGIGAQDLDRTPQDHPEVVRLVTRTEEDVTSLHVVRLAVRRQLLELRRVEERAGGIGLVDRHAR